MITDKQINQVLKIDRGNKRVFQFHKKSPNSQVSIPVKCVPSAAVAVCWGGVCSGVSTWGVFDQGGCLPGEVSARGGEGVCPGGVYPSMH